MDLGLTLVGPHLNKLHTQRPYFGQIRTSGGYYSTHYINHVWGKKGKKKKRLIRLYKLQVKVFYNLFLVEARARGQFHNYLNFFNMFSWWWWWFSHWVVSNSCDPMGCSQPGSSVHGISQARTLEWVAISFTGRESFLTQWLNLCFLHCNRSSELQADSLQLSHQLLFSRQVVSDSLRPHGLQHARLHYLPEFAQTHVLWVSDAIQPSHPLSLSSPPALNPSKHQGIFQMGHGGVLTKHESLEKGMANHFSILASRTPWTLWKWATRGLYTLVKWNLHFNSGSEMI